MELKFTQLILINKKRVNAEYVSLQISTPTFELIDTTQISDNNWSGLG